MGAAVNTALQTVGVISNFLTNAFTKTDTSDEMYANWTAEPDGGLREFIAWTLNDGDYPKEEAKTSYRMFKAKGKGFYLGKGLKTSDIVNKLKRTGLTDLANEIQSTITIQELQGGNINASELANSFDFGNETPRSILDQLTNILGDNPQNDTNSPSQPQTLQSNNNLFSLKNIAIGVFLIWIVKKIFK